MQRIFHIFLCLLPYLSKQISIPLCNRRKIESTENMEQKYTEYVVEINVGCQYTYQQSFYFLLDMTEQYNWLITSECWDNCLYSRKYNLNDDACLITSNRHLILYPYIHGYMANIEGKVSTNTFQFKQEKLNVNLSYIAAVESNYTTTIASGVITLSLGSYLTKHTNQNIIAQLFSQKIISEPIAAINLAYEEHNYETSSLDIGEYNTNIVLNKEDIHWEISADRASWAIDLESFEIKQNKHTYSLTKKAYVKPTEHHIFYPASLNLQKEVFDACYSYNSIPMNGIVYLINCSVTNMDYSIFPNITFLTKSGNFFQLLPQDYISFVPRGEGVYEANILLTPHKMIYYTFGVPFIKKYYTILDFENSTIGFYLKTVQNFIDKPEERTSSDFFTNAGFTIAVIFFLGIIGLIIYIRCH